MAFLKYILFVCFIVEYVSANDPGAFEIDVRSIDYEYEQIENVVAYFEDANELSPNEIELKFDLNDFGSEYVSQTLELAKDQVRKALEVLSRVISEELQSRLQNYTNIVIGCSLKNGIDKVPMETVSKLKVCFNETVVLAKPIANEFVHELKRVPVLFYNMTAEFKLCLVELRNSTDKSRIKEAIYCVARVASAKSTEIAVLANDIGRKGIETAKKLADLVPKVRGCYEERLEAVGKELQVINQKVAQCVNEQMNHEKLQ